MRTLEINFGDVIVTGSIDSEYVIVNVGQEDKNEGFFYAAGLIVRKNKPLSCGGIGSLNPEDDFTLTGKRMTLDQVLEACRSNSTFYSQRALNQIVEDSKKPARTIVLR